MKIAMTHDQADFDAIASLFAAARLENAIALLPQKLNHNVNAFLVLFWAEFNLVESGDLPNEAISEVVIVDTQSALTLRGMGRQTKFHFIDHHPLRTKDQPSAEAGEPGQRTVQIVDLGATTTYFVEQLQHQRLPISADQATLLLLGIYEDTGSLTYSKTTARDIHAAAWLVEQGAALSAITDYLNPPLNPQQLVVYEMLVDQMQQHAIKGHRILVSQAQVEEKVEEISTLAHKLRDLFEPDAVFIIVKTPEGVRLVARSSTDDIDVGAITAEFGGGGHHRAASALLRSEKAAQTESLEEIGKLLLQRLERKIRPAIPVSRLMSKKPLVMAPEQTLAEANALMVKYGYEGFPVARDGKVIGLLSRRSVDRALRHKLNFKVGNLMDAGTFAVHPTDPIQQVQSVMVESGWGQIPVVDPTSQKIVGIVTRTDIIKILATKKSAFASTRNMEKTLASQLSTDVISLIRTIADCADKQQMPVYLVGGFVRDLLLGLTSNDIDCVIEGDAIKIGQRLVADLGGHLNTHKRFGTARWYLEESKFALPGLPTFIDLITARQEFYEQPTVLPSVEAGNIKHDLHRRDFTINTLAIRIDGEHFGELHDYFGGKNDLDRKIIRVLHSLSFVDDPTRMIRAARYEARYGFTVDARTLQLMEEAAVLLGHLSQERVRHEFDLILEEKQPGEILARCLRWGLLEQITPSLAWDDACAGRLTAYLKPNLPVIWDQLIDLAYDQNYTHLGYALWFASFSQTQLEHIQQKFGFSIKLFGLLTETAAIIANINTTKPNDPFGWALLLENAGPISWYVAYSVTGCPEIAEYASHWRTIKPATDGKALIALGLKPGPEFQGILAKAKKARLNGTVADDEQERHWVQGLVENLQNERKQQ